MQRLRAKSKKLTGYLEFLLERAGTERFTVITPSEAEARGCQLDPGPRESEGTAQEARGRRA